MGNKSNRKAADFFKTVGNGITSAWHDVLGLGGQVVHEVGGAARGIVGTPGKVIGTLGGTMSHLGNNIQGDISSLGSSFAWPLALAGGAVALVFLMMRTK